MEADSILLPPNDFRKASYLNLPILLQIFFVFWIFYSFDLCLPSFRNETVFIYGVWLLLLPELWWSEKKTLHYRVESCAWTIIKQWFIQIWSMFWLTFFSIDLLSTKKNCLEFGSSKYIPCCSWLHVVFHWHVSVSCNHSLSAGCLLPRYQVCACLS